ncbi:IS66 family transposase [Romeria aff. gracilis LEGE 07310]|uniref:IS66 family transposase n=1 Tax=Vasconcelosia minhoensis LEGE 07310 TaxID=915328 RepID=A0A8J7DP47_9CYAN|nr:IS66 family transposase [Romeria gracilis]MBE9080541.1 IS66 family transposase [Romeria aff. gracilis LEGE 07310]
MAEEVEIAGSRIPQPDWEATPASVKTLVAAMSDQMAQLSERIAHLEEQLSKNSKNSSKPPSSDGFGQPPPAAKSKSKPRQRGGQPGHPGHRRGLYPSERCAEVKEHYPQHCRRCGEALSGEDKTPYRHQIVDLPSMQPVVHEHRLHQLVCAHCGSTTRAQLPPAVPAVGYGERLSAVVGLLSSGYRQSHQQVVALLNDVFDVSISSGSVNRIRRELSEAVAQPVAAAQQYVQGAAVLHSDETSFQQGNGDGGNPSGKGGWLWVLVTPLVSFFAVALSRSQTTAQALIGSEVSGIVVSDRYSSYNWIDLAQRQVCWAHLKRDLTAIQERSGASQTIGEALLRRERHLFRLWHRVRDGTLSRAAFSRAIEPLRRGFKRELEAAAQLPISTKERTPLAKTVRTCRKLLQVEPALWTFVDTPGVEPTNNAAERALRPAVIWRRTSFGSQSQAGSEFVARMLTVVASLNAQQRNVLAFLTQACRAARNDQLPPSLLPEPAVSSTATIRS